MNIRKLVTELDRRIQFHFNNQNDPHNIGNVAGAILREVRDCILTACDEIPPEVVHSPTASAFAETITRDLMTTADGQRATGLHFRRDGMSMDHVWIECVLQDRLKKHLTLFEQEIRRMEANDIQE